MTNKPQGEEQKTGYIKVNLDYAPKTDGKKFTEWCKKHDFDPLGSSGRRAWCSSFRTYFRGASGVAYADGEAFLFYEENLVDLEALLTASNRDRWRAVYYTDNHGDKQLPLVNVPVLCRLVWPSEKVVYAVLKRVEEDDVSWRTVDDDSELDYSVNVTHWQPIAELNRLGEG